MNMMEAVVSVFKNWKDFRGRACRSEFWYFYLATSILYIVFYFVDPATSPFEVPEEVPGLGLLTNIITLILLIPSLSVTARRLHDRGHSGWWQLSYLIVVGIIVIPLICAFPAKEEENKWGRNPLLEK